eukprot:scaffold358659_cov22-Prasinocladus_malaysianus.AAC.1
MASERREVAQLRLCQHRECGSACNCLLQPERRRKPSEMLFLHQLTKLVVGLLGFAICQPHPKDKSTAGYNSSLFPTRELVLQDEAIFSNEVMASACPS